MMSKAPPENELLLGAHAKVLRALSHVDHLDAAIDELFSGDFWEMYLEGDENFVKIRSKHVISHDMRLTVGEAVYQLRSALDHIAVAVAKKAGVKSKDVYFPLAGSLNDFEASEKYLSLCTINAGAAAAIRGFNPFKGGNDLLWGLGPLANVDKHNEMIVLRHVGNAVVIRNLHAVGAQIIVGGGNRIDEGIVVAKLGPSGTLTSMDNSKPNFEIKANLCFGAFEPFQNYLISPTLRHLAGLVSEIISAVEPHLSPTDAVA
jgi:hypothetical protein